MGELSASTAFRGWGTDQGRARGQGNPQAGSSNTLAGSRGKENWNRKMRTRGTDLIHIHGEPVIFTVNLHDSL